MFCFDKQNDMFIEGDFEANAFSAIEINIVSCQKKSEDEYLKMEKNGEQVIRCRPEKEINEILETA